MLRFAVAASVIGIAFASALVIWSYVGTPTRPEPLWAMFAGVFLAFGAAVLGHPKASASGTQVSVSSEEVRRTAPPWSTALVGAWLAYLIYCAYLLPERRFSIGSEADLVGRPDRFRTVSALLGAFYASGLNIALSGLKRQRDFLEWLEKP